MLASEQLLACSDAAPILRGQLGSESEWIADQREEKHEVDTLCCRRIIDRDGEGFGHDSSEQRRPRDMTGSGGRRDRNQFRPIQRLCTAWDLQRSTRRCGGQVGALAEPLGSEYVDGHSVAAITMGDAVGADPILFEAEIFES
jgi:hypothetical protein